MSTPSNNLDGQVQDTDKVAIYSARTTVELESVNEDNALVIYEAAAFPGTVMTLADNQEQEVRRVQESDEQQLADINNGSEIEVLDAPVAAPHEELQQPEYDARQPFVGYQHRIVTLHEYRPVIQQRTITDDGDNQVQYTYAGASRVHHEETTDVSIEFPQSHQILDFSNSNQRKTC